MRAGAVRGRLAITDWRRAAGRTLTAAARPLRQDGGLWRPARPRAFWTTAGLVSLVEGFHDAVEMFNLWPETGAFHGIPHECVLFTIPAVYAALNFGLRGALITTVGATLITIPNWIFLHDADERLGVISQMGIVYVVAILVGSRVTREIRARAVAWQAMDALYTSEAQYRAIFETAGDGVLVTRDDGAIVECNAAAGALLGRRPSEVIDSPAREMLPAALVSEIDAAAAARSERRSDILLTRADGQDVWVQPVCTVLPGASGLTQVILRDVTEQKHRQASLESYAAAILRAQEEERRRIAQELHDDTVQSLVLLCRRIDVIDEEETTADGPQRRRLAELRIVVESAMESLHAFIHGLRPSTLDDLGLTPAVRRLVTELDSGSGVGAELVVRGSSRRLLPDHELALYRIAQEALRNVERHSEASRATVTLHYQPQRIELSISDDGVGFVVPPAPDHAAADGRLGMLGMRERARIVGGTLEIHSEPGAGTTVIAVVPTDHALD